MTIKGNQVIPSGRPQPEVRANDGKNIKYEYGQLPEDEVFMNRPLTYDLSENVGIVTTNSDYFREKLNNIIDNPLIGNAEAQSYGGRSLHLAHNSLMGNSSAIDHELSKHARKYPVKSTSLVQSHINSERRSSPQRRNSHFQQNPNTYQEQSPYTEQNPYIEEYSNQHYSFAERLNNKFGNQNGYEPEPRLFNRSKSNRNIRKSNIQPTLPGKQFIKTANNDINQSEQELIAKIRERRQQISSNTSSEQGENIKKREVIGEKFNFEEI